MRLTQALVLPVCISLCTSAQQIKIIDGSRIAAAECSRKIKYLVDAAHVQGGYKNAVKRELLMASV